jgi:hypothetical protein
MKVVPQAFCPVLSSRTGLFCRFSFGTGGAYQRNINNKGDPHENVKSAVGSDYQQLKKPDGERMLLSEKTGRH